MMSRGRSLHSQRLWSLVFIACGACGGSGAQPELPQAPGASVGDEPPPAAQHAAPELAASASAKPGSIIVTAVVDGQPAHAHVRTLEASHGAELEGESGQQLSLPSGDQRIEVTISDSAALLDKPTQKLSVFVGSGKATPVEVTFPWSRVRLDVLVGGRSQKGVPVKLSRDGVVVGELTSGAPPQAISPGKYEADVLLRGRSIHVTGLTFLEGAEQTVPVRAQL